MNLISKLRKVRPRNMSSVAWMREKQKAAVLLKFSEKLGSRGIIRQSMKRNWYRHIDKAIAGKATERDYKHWKKMAKQFRKELVGVPNYETTEMLIWLEEFQHRIRGGVIDEEDKAMFPEFKKYMQSCEENAIDNYIIKNKLMEGFDEQASEDF